MLTLKIVAGILVAQLIVSALYRPAVGSFLFRALVVLALVVSIAAAVALTTGLDPNAIGRAWDAW